MSNDIYSPMVLRVLKKFKDALIEKKRPCTCIPLCPSGHCQTGFCPCCRRNIPDYDDSVDAGAPHRLHCAKRGIQVSVKRFGMNFSNKPHDWSPDCRGTCDQYVEAVHYDALAADRDQISLALAVAKADRDKWFNRAKVLEAHIEKWVFVTALQTFEDRERFRTESEKLLYSAPETFDE